METTEQVSTTTDPGVTRDFDYECAISGIRLTLGSDCVPIELHVPQEIFVRRTDDLSRILVTAFSDASAACQRHLGTSAGSPDQVEELADDLADDVAWADGGNYPTSNAPGPLDVDECLSRLHSVANCLTHSHHKLLTSTHNGTDRSALVHATANSSGTITALTLSPLLASEGIDAAQVAIVSATANAISAANNARAAVIEDALGTVLMNSLTRKWN